MSASEWMENHSLALVATRMEWAFVGTSKLII